MALMKKISELVEKYIIPCNYIDSSQLKDSGTGYIYPSLCDQLVTQFTDQYNRLGYLFQLVVSNKTDGTKKRSSFLVHCRYTDDQYKVVYSGLDELYYDCCVREYDQQKFLQRLELLLKGEIINNWYDKSNNVDEIQFKLSVQDVGEIKQRPFLVVIDPVKSID